MKRQGQTYEQIGAVLGVSKYRAAQILRDAGWDGLPSHHVPANDLGHGVIDPGNNPILGRLPPRTRIYRRALNKIAV